jgi:HAD superfamily hydrolase (TIGR01549 family)
MRDEYADIEAVTFDFYNTLAYHKQGKGRGAMLMEYLTKHGLESDPWEHQVLYDVFEQHGEDCSPSLSPEEKRDYLVHFAERVFQRLNVRATRGTAADHATGIWAELGPASLGVFPDVTGVLETLQGARYRLAVVSNWQCGLRHFCAELGIAGQLDHVVVSAEVGSEKPDPEIFRYACDRLGIPCGHVLHVGDSEVDDVEGARNAGMKAVLVRRDNGAGHADTPMIKGLYTLPGMLGLSRRPD